MAIFSKVQSWTAELASLEGFKTYICCGHFSAFIFDLIFLILASIQGIHKCLNKFEIRQHLTTD